MVFIFTDYTVSNVCEFGSMWEKRSWPTLRFYQSVCLENLKKTTRHFSRNSGVSGYLILRAQWIFEYKSPFILTNVSVHIHTSVSSYNAVCKFPSPSSVTVINPPFLGWKAALLWTWLPCREKQLDSQLTVFNTSQNEMVTYILSYIQA
jgi:hypothetical protein